MADPWAVVSRTPVAAASQPDPWAVRSVAPAQQPSMLDDALATPGARFAKGALLNPVTGAMQMAQGNDWLGRSLAPLLSPADAVLNSVSDVAKYFAPNNPVTAATQAYHGATNAAIRAVDQAFQNARANTGRGTGTDYYQGAGDVASAFMPMPGGKVRTATEGAELAARAAPLIADSIAPLTNDASKALQYISKLASTAGSTPERLAATGSENAGRGMTAAEALGPTGVAHLAALGRRAGQTGEALAGTLLTRSQGAPERILSDFASASGINPKAALGDMQDVVAAGRARARPLYDAAFAATPNTSDYMARLAADPVIQKGMANGIRIQRLQALARREPFDPNAYGVTGFNEAGDPIVSGIPTWRTWDAAKTGLDDMLESYRDKTTGRFVLDKMGHAINDVRASLVNELDSLNPAYKAARGAAGDYLSANDAFQKGQNAILNPNTTVKQVQDMLARFSDAERQAFNGGIANKLFNMAQNARLSALLIKTPALRQKLVAALGAAQADVFIRNVEREGNLARSGSRMMPATNSITSDIRNAVNEQDAGASAIEGGMRAANAAGHLFSGNFIPAAAHGLAAVRQFVPDFGRLGVMPEGVRNQAGQFLMMSPEDLAKTLQAARAGGIRPANDIPETILPRAGVLASALYGD